MGASLQQVEQKLLLNFFDYIVKNAPRGWAVLVLAALDLYVQPAPELSILSVCFYHALHCNQKNSKITFVLHVVM